MLIFRNMSDIQFSAHEKFRVQIIAHKNFFALILPLKLDERMSDVKKENEKRTTRYLDRTSSSAGSTSGLVNNKIVSRKHILANKKFSGGRSNDLHRYSHTHGSQNSRNASASSNMAPAANPAASGLNGCHPMLDRNKHKRPTNPEIMKRTLK